MKTTTIELIKLVADDNMTLTNGEAFGKEIYLGKTDKAENWYEIADIEAEKIIAERMQEDAEIHK